MRIKENVFFRKSFNQIKMASSGKVANQITDRRKRCGSLLRGETLQSPFVDNDLHSLCNKETAKERKKADIFT